MYRRCQVSQALTPFARVSHHEKHRQARLDSSKGPERIEGEHQRLIAEVAAADATADSLHRRTSHHHHHHHHHHSHQNSHRLKSESKWQDVVDNVAERTDFRHDRCSAVDAMQDDLVRLRDARLLAKSVQDLTGNVKAEGIPRSRGVAPRAQSPARIGVSPERHAKKRQVRGSYARCIETSRLQAALAPTHQTEAGIGIEIEGGLVARQG